MGDAVECQNYSSLPGRAGGGSPGYGYGLYGRQWPRILIRGQNGGHVMALRTSNPVYGGDPRCAVCLRFSRSRFQAHRAPHLRKEKEGTDYSQIGRQYGCSIRSGIPGSKSVYSDGKKGCWFDSLVAGKIRFIDPTLARGRDYASLSQPRTTNRTMTAGLRAEGWL